MGDARSAQDTRCMINSYYRMKDFVPHLVSRISHLVTHRKGKGEEV